jgi:hypothetical protein
MVGAAPAAASKASHGTDRPEADIGAKGRRLGLFAGLIWCRDQ